MRWWFGPDRVIEIIIVDKISVHMRNEKSEESGVGPEREATRLQRWLAGPAV